METCTIETGLLRKKPCGKPSATKCSNCEQPLCSEHALPVLVGGRKSGKFMCKECQAAHKAFEKATGGVDAAPAAGAKAPAAAPGGKPPAAAAAPAAKPAAGAKPAAPAKEAPAEKKKEEELGGALEFTPSKPPVKK